MKNVLMVCYGGGHATIIEPLYHRLKSEHSVTILALTTATHYFRKKNIPYVTFSDYKAFFSKEVVDYGEWLLSEMSLSPDVEYEDSLYYMGCSYYDLVQQHGLGKAKELYNMYGRSVFYPDNTVAIIINKLRPDIIIATNSPRAEKAALNIAKINKIPTLCINDGIWIETTNYGVLDIVNNNISDVVCVLSKEVKKKLEDKRLDMRTKIVATGTPVFDSIKKITRKKTTNKITVLYADCNLPASLPQYPDVIRDPQLAERVRFKLNELSIEKNWRVIFRMHPNQSVDYSKYKNVIISRKDQSLHRLLSECDVVLTNVSTVGIEGRAMGLGLVSLEGTIYNLINSFYKDGLSTPVYHEDEIYCAVMQELRKTPKNNDLYDGFAVDNIVREIDLLLYSHR